MLTIITYCVLTLSVAITLGILIRMSVAVRAFKRRAFLPEPNTDALPTVSVCIPARNESNAMTQCLERVIASNYPKLEIIVFDDQSGDNTSFLIKSFAHAGVRFIDGSPLPEGWLGKNFAQHHLYRESSGEYILYLDVDTHITPSTISTLVAQITSEKATMISVLPSRNDSFRMSVLFATLRYFWTLIFHRSSRPAVASSLWLISRSYLEEHGDGFENRKDTIEPEVSIAAELMRSDRYHFYINDAQLGVSYEKKWLSQCETAIRLLFPFVGGTSSGCIAALGGLFLLIFPAHVLIVSVSTRHWSYETLTALVALSLFFLAYAIYLSVTWTKGRIIGLILLPITLLQEVVLLLMSAYRYKTNTITWKGRPIYSSPRVKNTQ